MASIPSNYTLFDAIRSRVRTRAVGRSSVLQKTGLQSPGNTGLRTGKPGAVGVGEYDTTFLGEPGASTPFGMSSATTPNEVVNLNTNPELRAVEGMEYISRPKAAAESNLGSYGPFDATTGIGRAASSFISAIDPSPLGAFGAIFSGTTTLDPYGKTVAKPYGVLGKVSKMNAESQFEVAEKIRAGTPGFHQFYSGGQLVSITPQTIMGSKVGYATLGGYSGDTQQAINEYSAAMGYDPSTVDLNSRPGDDSFGVELDAFVPGSGGFGANGQFMNVSGEEKSLGPTDLGRHLGLTADIYGVDRAMSSLSNANVPSSVKEQMMGALTRGELTAEPIIVNGETVGYNTGSGSLVTSTETGDYIPTGSGGITTSGAGVMSASLYNSLRSSSNFMQETGADGAFTTGNPVSGFTEVSGQGESSSPVGGYNPNDSYGNAPNTGDTTDTYFAEGGRVPPDQVPAGNAPVASQAGFIEQEPEGLPNGTTVADDVPLEVPEGTFILSAPSVEFMGSQDVKKMILDAMKEAETQGVDVQQQNTSIPKEELVSLVVSKGEVVIPPQLSEIIGYDRLNKINNRGKKEVEKRVQEAAETQEAPSNKPRILAKSGGFISKSV